MLLSLFLSPPALFYPPLVCISSSRPIVLSAQSSVFFSGSGGRDEKRAVHSVWSRGRDIFPDSPLPVEFHHPSKRQKQKGGRRSSVRPHAAFRRLSIREIVIYICMYRHCVAVDIQPISKEVAKIALYATIRQTECFRCVSSLSLSRAFVRTIGRYNKTRKWLPVKHGVCIDRWIFFQASPYLFCHLFLLLLFRVRLHVEEFKWIN